MKAGNLSQTVWRRSVQKQLHIEETGGLLPPVPGERCSAYRDLSGAIRIRAYAAVSGGQVQTVKHAIWQAVNDVACRGGVACGAEVQVLFPVNAQEQDVKILVSKTQSVCRQIGITLDSFQAQVNPAAACMIAMVTVEGIVIEYPREKTHKQEAAGQGAMPDRAGSMKGNFHTEFVGQMCVQARPLDSCVTNIEEPCGLVRMQAAPPGVDLVICGFAGLSGSLQIAKEQKEELQGRFTPAFLRQTEELEKHLSQYETILTAQKAAQLRAMSTAEQFHIYAMQQAADGGVFAALWELAEAAGIGLEINLKNIPICQETVEICEYYQLNPYQMNSTGCILFVTDRAETLIQILEENGARAGRLGVTTAENARVITSGEERRYLERPAPDERMRFLAQQAGSLQK